MNFKDIEEIVHLISDKAEIKYGEKMTIYHEDENDEYYDKRKINYKYMSIFIHMNGYQILIGGVRFKDNRRLIDPTLDVLKNDENLNQIVFDIQDEEYDPILDNIKCNRRNLKKALKWANNNTTD